MTIASAIDLIDLRRLSATVAARRQLKGLSQRAAADEIGMSFATVQRIESGDFPDIGRYLLICAWLELEPSEFFVTKTVRPETTMEKIAATLYADPKLPPGGAERIVAVIAPAYELLVATR